MTPMRFHYLYSLLLAAALLLGTAPARATDSQPWVLVDTRQQTLSVIQHGRIIEEFSDIAVGRGGTAEVRLRGDKKTPLGEFRVGWVNRDSSYHLFFGLSYPGEPNAREALKQHLLDEETYEAIRRAVVRNQTPPQNTPLGGNIGIHGLGKRDMEIHRSFNWTEGCIALTNGQIERLARWVDIGTRVVIR